MSKLLYKDKMYSIWLLCLLIKIWRSNQNKKNKSSAKEQYWKKKSMLRVWKSLKYIKKSIYYHFRKKQHSQKDIQKRRSFLYKNHRILFKHQVFIHYFEDFQNGFTNDFEREPLRSQAFAQRSSLSQSMNKNTKFHHLVFHNQKYPTRHSKVCTYCENPSPNHNIFNF